MWTRSALSLGAPLRMRLAVSGTVAVRAAVTPAVGLLSRRWYGAPVGALKMKEMGGKEDDGKDLEIKDAHVIFDTVFAKIEQKFAGQPLIFPKEIIFLGGAPGAGKGTNTGFILKARGISAPPVVMSSMLDSDAFKDIKARGEMISDAAVFQVLLETLLKPIYQHGALVDGFPRTTTQVELTRRFHDKMMAIRKKAKGTLQADLFPRPAFKMAVLFVEEVESLRRQLLRGQQVLNHNKLVRSSGQGQLLEERPTDFDEKLVRRRYAIFKQHYSTLQELQKVFPFHLINAGGSLEEVQRNIIEQFQYQSSLELSEKAFDVLHTIPMPQEIILHARQQMIQRLEMYCRKHSTAFKAVVGAINTQFMPIIQQHCLAGDAIVHTADPLFTDKLCVDMVLDVMSERGYIMSHHIIPETFGERVDISNGRIINRTIPHHVFKITFPRAVLRLGGESRREV